jgi:hypothetical protein
MNRRYIALAELLLFSVAVGGSALTQDSPSNSSPAAQSGQAMQPSSQNTSSASLLPAPNRVWTNDDLSDLRAGTGVSNHAAPRAKFSKTAAKPATISKGKDANWYHGQIAKLQAQLPPIESQISNYHAALAGKPVDETRMYGWTRPADWSAQLAKLQQKHDDISSKIAALEDEGRHNSIPANSLP